MPARGPYFYYTFTDASPGPVLLLYFYYYWSEGAKPVRTDWMFSSPGGEAWARRGGGGGRRRLPGSGPPRIPSSASLTLSAPVNICLKPMK